MKQADAAILNSFAAGVCTTEEEAAAKLSVFIKRMPTSRGPHTTRYSSCLHKYQAAAAKTVMHQRTGPPQGSSQWLP